MHIDLILTHILLTVHIIIIKKWRNKKNRDRCYLLITNMDHTYICKVRNYIEHEEISNRFSIRFYSR